MTEEAERPNPSVGEWVGAIIGIGIAFFVYRSCEASADASKLKRDAAERDSAAHWHRIAAALNESPPTTIREAQNILGTATDCDATSCRWVVGDVVVKATALPLSGALRGGSRVTSVECIESGSVGYGFCH